MEWFQFPTKFTGNNKEQKKNKKHLMNKCQNTEEDVYMFYKCLVKNKIYTYIAKIINKATMNRMHVVLFFLVGFCLQQQWAHKQNDVTSKIRTQNTTGKAARKTMDWKRKINNSFKPYTIVYFIGWHSYRVINGQIKKLNSMFAEKYFIWYSNELY